jgi:hypothetical protein
MGCNVYANNHEVACKASGHKVIAEFPDVCMSPPSPPAGPIPVPYPDTSFAKDMKQGSKTVKIKRKEIMLRDQSFYKSSPLGNEAATRSFGANLLSHTITGKTYFVAWSMDVKVEGKNVDRNVDMVTSNHASTPPGTGPLSVSLAEMARFVVRDVKDAARWARHVNPATCGGVHDWECNKKACADCWQPPCAPNAKKEQENYEASQSGTQQDKVNAHKESNRRKRQKGHDRTGLDFEEAAVAKQTEKIEHIGYAAHCRVCHMEGDLDIVTESSVIECKRTRGDLRQMQENIVPIARKCFPGKQVKIATRATRLNAMRQTVSSPGWRPLNVQAVDP